MVVLVGDIAEILRCGISLGAQCRKGICSIELCRYVVHAQRTAACACHSHGDEVITVGITGAERIEHSLADAEIEAAEVCLLVRSAERCRGRLLIVAYRGDTI